MGSRTGNMNVKETKTAKHYELWVVVERYDRPSPEVIQHIKEDC